MALEIRPIDLDGPGAPRGWLRSSHEPEMDEAALRAVLAHDPRAALIAWEGGEIVGALWGSRTSFGYRIEGLRTGPGRPEAVAVALLAALDRQSTGQILEACLLLDAGELALRGPLRRAGYRDVFEEVWIERGLADIEPDEPDPFEYRALPEIGRASLVAAMARCPLGPGFDVEAELEEMIHAAGAEPDRDLWTVVHREGRPLGVLLLQRLPDDPGCGSILYMGIFPEARGRGLGKALHRAALCRLAALGLTGYIDTARTTNLAMRRIFAANGCLEVSTRRISRKLVARGR